MTIFIQKTCLYSALVVAALSIAACGQTAPDKTATDMTEQTSTVDRASADIGDLRNGGVQVTRINMPEQFERGEKIVAYEGPGWESDKVGFRLYLDERNALDIFGKKTDAIVLSTVGRGNDYHAMADWGMDILKVGNSLGAGGFGIFKDGEVVQIGEAAGYSAEVSTDNNDSAAVVVTHSQSIACGGDVRAQYSIEAGERISRVSVRGDCNYPYAAGMIIHPDTQEMTSSSPGDWQYIARYGEQSLIPDGLGMALFYKASDVARVGKDNDDHYIVFKDNVSPNYYTAAAWSQEKGGLKDAAEFASWLDTTQRTLNAQ
ncbi:DUF4861 family protein [Fretibacter rubidus]|uniref:DUF4861 family protein n=1 Tax=Fretibacter rubidus TaxID=570162 RepID=UPI00352B6839